jgi:Putative zinc-finger
MTIVGLHPEDLFDKMLDGELTSQEDERLRAHLQACDVCRFEYAARLDFQAEALALASIGPPPVLPLRPLLHVEPVKAPRRRRARLVVWGLAAAALITASGAVASGWVGAGSWHALGLMFSSKTLPAESSPSLVKPVAARAVATPALEVAPVVEAAPVIEAVPVVEAAPLPAKREAHAHGAAKPATPSAAVVTQLASLPASSGEAPGAKEGAAKEPPSAAKLFGEANQARRSGDVGRASGLYHLLQDQFPGSPEAELSRVTLALLLLDSGDAQGALSGFERYLASSSRGLEAEALVGRARALGRLGRRDLETAAWQEVRRKYPRSIYGRQAGERLAALGQP